VADQNYVVASIEYRTVPEGATYKQTVSDVKSAVRYLRAHAGQYDIDSSKVAVWGQPAGGYVASMAGVTNARHDRERRAALVDQADHGLHRQLPEQGAPQLIRLALEASFGPAGERPASGTRCPPGGSRAVPAYVHKRHHRLPFSNRILNIRSLLR